MTKRRLEVQVDQTGNAKSGLTSLASSLGKVGAIAGGAALTGIVALGAGIAGTGVAGLSMNNSMELAQARINAFTKDSGKTAEILDMVRTRAAKTPFEFQAMADAAAALLPSAKQAQMGLEDLIAQAEILAASNPAEGLEGAAFALKEAVSGDFTSIIERFNLPRQFINQLKEEGVPNIQIVQMAMKEMGLDMDLVSALANTASGRWSTLKDTFTNFASTITKPIFEKASSGLGQLNDLLAENEPALQAVADVIATGLSKAMEWLGQLVPKLAQAFQQWAGPTMRDTVRPALMIIRDSIERIGDALGINTKEISGQDMILKLFKATLSAVTTAIQLGAVTMHVIANAFQEGRRVADKFNSAVQSLRSTFSNSMSSIRSGINSAISAWKRFEDAVKDAVDAIPTWLIPHSPTAFEIGLRGIADATTRASGALSKMPTMQSNNPAASLAPAPIQPVVVPTTGQAGNITVHLTYSPLISTADRIEAEERLGPILIDVLRTRGVRV